MSYSDQGWRSRAMTSIPVSSPYEKTRIYPTLEREQSWNGSAVLSKAKVLSPFMMLCTLFCAPQSLSWRCADPGQDQRRPARVREHSSNSPLLLRTSIRWSAGKIMLAGLPDGKHFSDEMEKLVIKTLISFSNFIRQQLCYQAMSPQVTGANVSPLWCWKCPRLRLHLQDLEDTWSSLHAAFRQMTDPAERFRHLTKLFLLTLFNWGETLESHPF